MVVDFDESAGLTAVVDAGGARQSITINLYSDGRFACWSFLQKLRDEILLINAEMNLVADDYIIMETNNIQDRFLVKDILNRRAKGKTDCWASNLCDDYEITDILGSAYGFANASIIEDMAETERAQDNIELLNEILKLSDKIMQSIGGLSKQIAEYHGENETNQEALLAILNTMNKKKTALQLLKEKLLSGVSISADMLALVQFANPGLAENMLKAVSEMMIQILPTLFS